MSQQSVSSESVKACGRLMRVVANTRLCNEHTLLELATRAAPDSHPGQFLQILCRDQYSESEANATPAGGAFLRRPFSIADQWRADDGVHISIISRTIGRGTAWLERLTPDQTVDVTGPIGHGFDLPDDNDPIVLMGGGVGIPPLLFLARRLHEAGRTDVTVIFGATSENLLPLRLADAPPADGTASQCVALPGDARYSTVITTDDGSCGLRGVVTDALRIWSSTRTAEDLKSGVVCACGPDAMLRAAADATREIGLKCQLCIERHMGCGLGTCLSCVVRVADDSRPTGWRWALACSEGPVFDRDALRCWS